MTIFGFNTDIRSGDTVYHVQTEAREAELLLQSAVFVRGRCIGKHVVSYGGEVAKADFCEEHVHGLLTSQHRFVVTAVREGRLDSVLQGAGAPCAEAAPVDRLPDSLTATPPGSELLIEWLQAVPVFSDKEVCLRLCVRRGGDPVAGAKLIARVEADGCVPVYGRTLTASNGEAEMTFALADCPQTDSQGLTVLVQAAYDGSSSRRKFRLRRA